MIDAIATPTLKGLQFALRYPAYLHGYIGYIAATHGVDIHVEEKEDAIKSVRELPALANFDHISDTEPCQDGSEVSKREFAQKLWRAAAIDVAAYAEALSRVDPSIVNRVLLPFAHNNVTATASDWTYFFSMLNEDHHPPEVKELIQEMHNTFRRRMM